MILLKRPYAVARRDVADMYNQSLSRAIPTRDQRANEIRRPNSR